MLSLLTHRSIPQPRGSLLLCPWYSSLWIERKILVRQTRCTKYFKHFMIKRPWCYQFKYWAKTDKRLHAHFSKKTTTVQQMFSKLCVTTAWPKFGLPVITAFLNYTGPVASFRTGYKRTIWWEFGTLSVNLRNEALALVQDALSF